MTKSSGQTLINYVDMLFDSTERRVPMIDRFFDEIQRLRRPDVPSLRYSVEKAMQKTGSEMMEKTDSSLPRPIRGQDTFGYSFSLFCTVAETMGCQRRPFSFQEVKIIAQSGLQIAIDRVQAFNGPEFRETFKHLVEAHYNRVSVAESSREAVWAADEVDHPYIDKAWIVPFRALLRHVEWINRQLINWMAVNDCVESLVKLGMPEGGLAARAYAMTDGPARGQIAFLKRLLGEMALEAAATVKEGYAGSEIGQRFAERRLQPFWSAWHSLQKSKGPWNENVRFSFRHEPDIERDGAFQYHLAQFCLSSDNSIFREISPTYAGNEDSHKPDLILMKAHQVGYERAAIQDPTAAAQISQYLREAIAEFTIVDDLAESVDAVFPPDHKFRMPDPEFKGSLRNFAIRYHQLHGTMDELHLVLCELTEAAFDACQDGEDLILEARANNPAGKSSEYTDGQDIDYSKRYREAMKSDDPEALPMVLLEYAWLELQTLMTFEDYAIPWITAEPDIARKPTWSPQPKVKRENPNLGVPVSSERLAVSGHTFARCMDKSTSTDLVCTPLADDIDPAKDVLVDDTIVPPLAHPIFTLNRNLLKIAERVFSTGSDEGRQGKVSWRDIITLMKRMNFRVDEVGGSIVRFVPPDEAGPPMLVHRPHPQPDIHAIQYRAFGKKLNRKYGITIDWFARTMAMEN